MPLMGSLYVGASGLQTSQNVLNAVAHNMTNVDTTGYVRQQPLLATKMYNTISVNPKAISNQQIGLGVNYSATRQVRDYFLDKTYRRESGRSMFYEVSTEVMGEVENLLGELNGEDFQTALSNLWTSVEQLAENPSSSVTQGLLVQRASEFLSRAGAVYNDLCAYQNNLNTQIKQKINTVNEYGRQIQQLNNAIRKVEAGGVEHANDMRDARNQLLDELAKLTKMDYKENAYGDVEVQIEGVDFVKGGLVFEMETWTDPATGFYKPYWPQNTEVYPPQSEKDIKRALVFDLQQDVSSTLNTDIGGLKAMLLARGDFRADCSDMKKDYDKVSQSIVMNMQAEFDMLVHNITTKMNSVLASAYNPDTGYMCDEDGAPLQLFQKINSAGYTQGTDGKWNYVEEDWNSPETLYSVRNLQINSALMKEPGKLGFKLDEESVDYATAAAMKEAFAAEEWTLNPNVQKQTNFINYYTDLVAQVANSGQVFCSIYNNQEATVQATFDAREQVIGVSTDEELSNMIKFQNAFNASSRYINVIDEMLEHVLNALAG